MKLSLALAAALAVGVPAALALSIPVPPSVKAVPADNGLMVNVPNFGQSRFETVAFCLQQSKVDKYQNLTTDLEFETFNGCMLENT
jgi:hypothetical protein